MLKIEIMLIDGKYNSQSKIKIIEVYIENKF